MPFSVIRLNGRSHETEIEWDPPEHLTKASHDRSPENLPYNTERQLKTFPRTRSKDSAPQ